MYDDLRQQLVDLRRARGLSLTQVARKFSGSKQLLSNWESGRNQPTLDNLAAWAAGIGYRLSIQIVPAEVAATTSEVTAAVSLLPATDQAEVIFFADTLRRSSGLSRRLLLAHVQHLRAAIADEPVSGTGTQAG